MKVVKLSFVLILFFAINAYPLSTGRLMAERNLIINVDHRSTVSLNGKWRVIIDPYENGYYDYRYLPNRNGYFKNAKPRNKTDLIEYDFDKSEVLSVPGDWNSQQDKLLFYEGTIWYKKSFPLPRLASGDAGASFNSEATTESIRDDVLRPVVRVV